LKKKKAFLAKYNHLLEEKKEEFLAENQDPNEDFQYLAIKVSI
jgi:hypothetical protein